MFEFTCQHSKGECYGNALESCICNHADTRHDALNSIACMFANTYTYYSLLDSAFEECAQ